MNFKAYGLKNLPSSNIDVNGLYFIKKDVEEEFKIYIRKADNSAWVSLGTTGQITSVNGLTGSSVQLDLDFTGGVLGLTGSGTTINLDARYVGVNDDIAWSKITGRPTTLSGYGITDAAKDNEVVKLTGNQLVIAGNKRFTGSLGVPTAVAYNEAVRKEQLDAGIDALQQQINAIGGTVSSGVDLKGEIDASTNPVYPSADKGDMWVISTAGKIGGVAGIEVDVGNTLICISTTSAGTQSQVGDKWAVLQSDLDQATESKAGFAKIATQAIVYAGTNDTDIVTAKKLRVVLDGAIDDIENEAEGKFVRYDASQSLDDTEAGQARVNINAASDDDVLKRTGNQQGITGIKTFSEDLRYSGAITLGNHVVNKLHLETYSEGKFVMFDASQSLSSVNKSNARNNIDAASVEDVKWAAKEW